MLKSISKTVEVRLSVEDIADAFAKASDYEQAEFLERVAAIFFTWQPHERCLQIHSMAKKIERDSQAHEVLAEIVAGIEEGHA